MTGGQPVEGQLSVADVCRQVLAEGITRVVVVSSDPDSQILKEELPSEIQVVHRDQLERVQRVLREEKGVTILIYDQTCAAELRRRRKRKTAPEPDRRVIINDRVCEGCGDCSSEANCVSILPLDTALGRKRQIDQSSCNKDFSCLKGFCPSFVTVIGGKLQSSRLDAPNAISVGMADAESSEVRQIALPEPTKPALSTEYNVMIAGIGGTGVVTVGAILAMAGHLEGRSCTTFDMTGLAQKGGAVHSHLRFAVSQDELKTAAIGIGGCDLVIGCDAVVAASAAVTKTFSKGRTHAVINRHVVPTARFQLDKEMVFDGPALLSGLATVLDQEKLMTVDATAAAQQR
jgi:indolepyruvate ferredoxin oxidoreductase